MNNNAKFDDFIYTDIYLISVINPSNATIISCRHGDGFLNIGDNIFTNSLMSVEERQILHRRIILNDSTLIAAAIGNRLAIIITDLSSSLKCFVVVFPRLPYKDVLSLIKDNRLGKFDVFSSTEKELYEYQYPYNYKIEETYQLLNKIFYHINIYRNSCESVIRSERNPFLSAERILQKIIGSAAFVGCKLYVKESNYKPYYMINLNLPSLCDYTICTLFLARRLSVSHSATLSFVENSNMISFIYTIDCYKPPHMSKSIFIKQIAENYPELNHCEKSSNFNNCIFHYKVEQKKNSVKLIVSISTYISDDSTYGLKSPF